MTVPNSVRQIEKKAFADCLALKNIAFQDDSMLEEIGEYAFCRSRLETFSAPSSLRNIGEGAFYSCDKLASVEFQEGLETIGDDSFSLTKLRDIVFPMSLKRLGDYFSDGNEEIIYHIFDTTDVG